MALHKEVLCPSKHTISLPKKEVKSQPWEHRLVDESCGNEVQTLLKKGKEWEAKYIQGLPKPGIFAVALRCDKLHYMSSLFQENLLVMVRDLVPWTASRQLLGAIALL